MSKTRNKPISFLKTLLRYEESTGKFYWRLGRGSNARVGKEAGFVHQTGYIHIHTCGKIYKGHRLAWAFKTGKWPRHDVEHRDLNKANNAWENLRKTDDFKNQANTRKRPNKSGFKSVTLRSEKRYSKPYRARIGVRNRRINLGHFATAEEAHAAYAAAAKKYFGEFSRLA